MAKEEVANGAGAAAGVSVVEGSGEGAAAAPVPSFRPEGSNAPPDLEKPGVVEGSGQGPAPGTGEDHLYS
jgi:hypothetical protein